MGNTNLVFLKIERTFLQAITKVINCFLLLFYLFVVFNLSILWLIINARRTLFGFSNKRKSFQRHAISISGLQP